MVVQKLAPRATPELGGDLNTGPHFPRYLRPSSLTPMFSLTIATIYVPKGHEKGILRVNFVMAKGQVQITV